jgi:hypothetical protein
LKKAAIACHGLRLSQHDVEVARFPGLVAAAMLFDGADEREIQAALFLVPGITLEVKLRDQLAIAGVLDPVMDLSIVAGTLAQQPRHLGTFLFVNG